MDFIIWGALFLTVFEHGSGTIGCMMILAVGRTQTL